MPVILCYDAGFVTLGWVAAELPSRTRELPRLIAGGICHVPAAADLKATKMAQNLDRINQQVEALECLHRMFRPVAYFIEYPHAGAKGAIAIRAMAYASACMSATLHSLHVACVVPLLPSTVKKAVCGDSNAEKDLVEITVRRLWPRFHFDRSTQRKGLRHNLYDAAAVCYTATKQSCYGELVERGEAGAGRDRAAAARAMRR